MQKKIRTLGLYLCFIQLGYGQESNLIGKWRFHSIPNINELDSTGQKLAKSLLQSFVLILNDRHHFQIQFFSTENGDWTYDQTRQIIEFKGDKGHISKRKIGFDTTGALLFYIEDNKPVLLVKEPIEEYDDFQVEFAVIPYKTAQKKQISKKWYLKSRSRPHSNPQMMEIITELFQKSYFHFQENGSYELQIGTIIERGTWSIEDKGQTIVYGDMKDKKFWKIKEVNDNQLELVKGNTKEIWVFSSTP